MRRIVAADALDSSEGRAVLALLADADAEFVPPLSARTSTHQADLLGASGGDASGPLAYFRELAQQPFLLAEEEGRVLGFLSYIEGYRLPWLEGRCTYVTTIVTAKEHRGEGVASALYGALGEHACPAPVLIRTWSTNAGQVHLLGKRGYEALRREKDARDKGIDTLYFLKRTA